MKKLTYAACAALLLAAPSALADGLVGGVDALLTLDDEYVVELREPTGAAFLPDGRMLITLRQGNLLVVPAGGGDPITAGTVSVSTSFQEKGLLNVAVHPDYATNHIIFLYYTSSQNDNRVSSFELSDDNQLDLQSEKRLVDGIAAPLNHDGGGLYVLGDKLYIGTGDAGSNSNVVPYAQRVTNYYSTCLTNLNGKVLRLNLDGSIPQDNPLVGKMVTACGNNTGTEPTALGAAREEIFAWGFRNAFRVWGDKETGNLWVGHVGEVTFEMIDVVPPTGNKHFGWPFREGGEGFPPEECTNITPDVGNCVDPVYSCEQSDNKNGTIPNVAPCNDPSWGSYCDNPDIPNDCDSITGGLILSGCEWPDELRGKYVFGDYQSKNVWTLPVNEARDNVTGERESFAVVQGAGPVAFLEHEGALYIVAHSNMQGHVSKLTPKMTNAACMPTTEPTTPVPSTSMSTPVDPTSPLPSSSTTEPTAAPTQSAAPSASGGGTPTSAPAQSSAPAGSSAAPPASASGTPPQASGSSAPPAASTGAVQDGTGGDSGGCACRVGSPAGTGRLASLGLLALALGALRRRSRKQDVA